GNGEGSDDGLGPPAAPSPAALALEPTVGALPSERSPEPVAPVDPDGAGDAAHPASASASTRAAVSRAGRGFGSTAQGCHSRTGRGTPAHRRVGSAEAEAGPHPPTGAGDSSGCSRPDARVMIERTAAIAHIAAPP